MYYDSSDDEDNVVTNPYEGVKTATLKEMQSQLTLKKLENLRKPNTLFESKLTYSHQHLLRKAAIAGEQKEDNEKRSPSPFPATLQGPKKILDGIPSKPDVQGTMPETIIPSFRGIAWQSDIDPTNLFFCTRVHWEDEHNYASQVYTLAHVDIMRHTAAKFASNKELMTRYKKCDLALLEALHPGQLEIDNAQLLSASTKLKSLFDAARLVQKPFEKWRTFIPQLRNSIPAKRICTLTEILSHLYINNYSDFKELLKTFDTFVASLPSTNIPTALFQYQFNKLAFTAEELAQGIPYLSEGQIPRHALLYAFRVKEYSESKSEIESLYKVDLKPKENKTYIGKMWVSQNPHTLFQGVDKATFVPCLDKELGGKAVDKTIAGELEIQHVAANLQGTIKKGINTKLPKFHHQTAPKRYLTKYGLDKDLYQEFKSTFEFLVEKNQYNKLSWMYLESVVLAHLIQFHEIQLYKYSDKMATDMGKEINWVDRDGKEIENPFNP